MEKTAQQSLIDILVQLMPALQDLRSRKLKKDDPTHATLLDIWEKVGKSNGHKFSKPANIPPQEIRKLEAAGLIEDQGNQIRITNQGVNVIKVMILNDDTFALAKKAARNDSLGWYGRLKNDDTLH